jgi:phospholipid-translocating ATPase
MNRALAADSPHRVSIGNSYLNANFPRNHQPTQAIAYLLLLAHVVWSQLNSFFSVYFIIVGILSCLPEIGSESPATALVPLLVVVIMEFTIEAIDLYRSSRTAESARSQRYTVIRDHMRQTLPAADIMPGDLIEIADAQEDLVAVPCDVVLLRTSGMSLFINTSRIDGETQIKDRGAVHIPADTDFLTVNATISAPNPTSGTRDIRGEIAWMEGEEMGELQSIGSVTQFEPGSFIERSSILESPGNHVLVAIYTGVHCRSATTVKIAAARKTVVDRYTEHISLFIFTFQFLASLILALVGYVHARDEPIEYIPEQKFLNVIGGWKFVILLARHFLLLSQVVPITLKILLAVFRYIYGIFIEGDVRFADAMREASAKAVSTSMTENLGFIDVVISDKTGTLTRNELVLASIATAYARYGGTRRARTVLEDSSLKQRFETLQEDPSEDFTCMFLALSLCHTVAIGENQELYGASPDELAILAGLRGLNWTFTREPDGFAIKSPIGDYRASILQVNAFDRDRMRMSVIAQVDGRIFVFMKGAPERVVSQCTAIAGPTSSEYLHYEGEGMRSLCVSYKVLEAHEARLSVEECEQGHTLLGSVGIEDQLQNDAHVTIGLLSRAGIKIWVATGDAQRNTVVIASQLKLARTGENVLHLNAETLRNPKEWIAAAFEVEENSFSTLVNCESADDVRTALETPKFIQALYQGRCVVFYRCKPQTKAEVAVALQNAGKRVLAIGDGANDSTLLKQADVGIGILGPKNQMSFATCHFAIPTFGNLSRLVLVHGHLSMHRSLLAINSSFYKAVLFGCCQILYQVWTDSTAQSFFDSSSTMLFNYVWTLIPVASLLFEKDISDNVLIKLAHLYRPLRESMDFRPSNLLWFWSASVEGFLLMVVVYLLTGEAFLTVDGLDLGQSYLSLLVYIGLVIICVIEIANMTNIFTYYSLLLIVGTVLLIISTTAVVQGSETGMISTAWAGFFSHCLNSFEGIVLIMTIVLVAVTPAWVGRAIWQEYQAPDWQRVIEAETIAAKHDHPLFFDSVEVED